LITSVANGNVLSYDGTKWVNSTRLTNVEFDISNIQDGTTIVGRAYSDQNGDYFTTTYLKNSTASATYIPLSQKGANNGVATLNGSGKVPSSQLPGTYDEILEYDTLEDFPEEGTEENIYLAKDTNVIYRWSGTQYVEISPSIALGETSSTAYRGDRGKTAYDHSQIVTGNPHGTTIGDIGAEPANANIQAHITLTNGSNPHLTTFANIATKPTTLGGYGITDALTSTEISSTYLTQSNATSTYIPLTQKGAVNGVASLDAQSKIPFAQLPSSVIGGMKFDGPIDITDNVTNTLSKIAEDGLYNSVADKGNYKIVSYGGTIEEGAEVDNYIGKWEFGTLEEDTDPTTTLTLEAGDWLVVTNVQPNTPTSGKFTVTFAVVNNTYQDATTLLKGVTRLSDATTYASLTGNDVVTEGVLKTTVDNASFASGTHTHGNITNDGAITSTVITPTNDDAIILSDSSASNVLKRGISIGTSTTTFLRNDGTWATPESGGGGGDFLPLTGGNITGNLNVSGNIGIGTTTPLNKLDLRITGGDSNNGIMITREDATTTTNEILGGIGFDSTDGNVPSSILEASAYIAAFAAEDHSVGDKGGYLTFGTSPIDQDDDTVSVERMRIRADGNVGIGNTNPNEKLSVTGQISSTSTIYANSFYNNNYGTLGGWNYYQGFFIDSAGTYTLNSNIDLIDLVNEGKKILIVISDYSNNDYVSYDLRHPSGAANNVRQYYLGNNTLDANYTTRVVNGGSNLHLNSLTSTHYINIDWLNTTFDGVPNFLFSTIHTVYDGGADIRPIVKTPLNLSNLQIVVNDDSNGGVTLEIYVDVYVLL
jgi:hypothetical protein